jgi:hypothetical protein
VDSNTGTIYAAGSASYRDSKNRNSAPTNLWLVRRSTDNGVTWETFDSFNYGSGTTPVATGITLDSLGYPVVSGNVTTSQGARWLVRRLMPTTTYVKQGKNTVPVTSLSWVTSDDWLPAPGLTPQGVFITCHGGGNLYATGGMSQGDGTTYCHWFTRKLAAPSGL